MPSLRGGRGRVSFSVQIAALRDELRAKQLAREVQAAGFPATIVESGASRDARIFRVRVGRYEDRAGAVKVAGEIEEGTIVFIVCDGGWKYLSTGAYTADLDEAEKEIGRAHV